jgi:hypothetical protein
MNSENKTSNWVENHSNRVVVAYREEWWLICSDAKIVYLQSWVRIQQSPAYSELPVLGWAMGCHLGWHFTVGCPPRGGRGEYKQ